MNTYIFHGPNDLETTQKIAFWTKNFKEKHKNGELIKILASDKNRLNKLKSSLHSQGLFSSFKLIILYDILSDITKDEEKLLLDSLEKIPKETFLVFSEKKLDKRKKLYKNFIKFEKQGNVKLQEFKLPTGIQLNAWVEKQVKLSEGKIGKIAAAYFAEKMGRDLSEKSYGQMQEHFSLWKIKNEIDKLIAYKNGNEIVKKDIDDVVKGEENTKMFDFLNAAACQDKQKALKILHNIMASQKVAKDEISRFMYTFAMLVSQIRNLIILKDLQDRKFTQDQIAQTLGWKSGRVYIVGKLASNFSLEKLKQIYSKLAELDLKSKTQKIEHKVELDMLILDL